MESLSEEARERNIVEMRKVGEEPLLPEEVHTEDELSQGENSDDDSVVIDELLAQREQLLKQKAEADKHIKLQEKALKDKQKSEREQSIRKELEELKRAVSLQQERIQYLALAMDDTATPATPTERAPTEEVQPGTVQTPGVNPRPAVNSTEQGGARPKTGVVPGTPGPLYSSVVQGLQNVGALDPALAAYAKAAALAAGVHVEGVVPGPAREPVVVQQVAQPVVAPAVAAGSSKKPDSGKCLPEHYVMKPADSVSESHVNYYEFVHGLLRFLNAKHVEQGESIVDYLKYYVQIANLACQYKWSAVYKVHLAVINDMEIGECKSWGDPISNTVVHRYCNFGANLPDDSAGFGGDRRSRRDSPSQVDQSRRRLY